MLWSHSLVLYDFFQPWDKPKVIEGVYLVILYGGGGGGGSLV